jgi:hypothetical protein
VSGSIASIVHASSQKTFAADRTTRAPGNASQITAASSSVDSRAIRGVIPVTLVAMAGAPAASR